MKKSKITGFVGTLSVHVLVVVLLLLLNLDIPEKQEEGGVPVMMGNTDLAQGNADPYMMTEVDVMPQPQPDVQSLPEQQTEVEQPMITQQDEPSLTVKEEKTEVVREKTEAEKRAEAEKAAAQAAASKIAGAFGKGAQMGSKGTATSGSGVQGRTDGNNSTG